MEICNDWKSTDDLHYTLIVEPEFCLEHLIWLQ